MHKLYNKVTKSIPLLITVAIHAVLIAIAGYFVSEQVLSKKRAFEATALPENSIAQKNVEHRLQVARKAGGSASSSPVSATRIFSSAKDSLQMPALPELPSVGASSLSGMGFGAGSGAVGTGTGMNTGGLGNVSLGSGFMSMSFLGITNQKARNVVFMIDISPSVMDIRKGGFQAFTLLRTEISRLVGNMSPATSFNVVFFEQHQIRLFAKELQPSTVANKTLFFEWIKSVNADVNLLGARSIPESSPRWLYKPADSLKLDPDYGPAEWVQAIHAALEQKADTIFLITGSGFPGGRKASEAEITHNRQEREKIIRELKQQGIDLDVVNAARRQSLEKARVEFDAMNRELVSQKKDPFVIAGNIRRLMDADMQAAMKRVGYTIKVDTSGWTDKAGNPIWHDFTLPLNDRSIATFADAANHITRLQYGLLRDRAMINIFMFMGVDEHREGEEKNLAGLASKNGGKFSVLTTKRIEELAKPEQKKK
jgi:hypothetical protein